MATLKSAGLFILALLFFFSQFLALGMHAGLGAGLNEAVYLKAMEETGTFEQLTVAANEMVGQQGIPITLSEKFVKAQTQVALGSVMRYLKGETETLEGSISMGELRDSVLAEAESLGVPPEMVSSLLPEDIALQQLVQEMGAMPVLEDAREQVAFVQFIALGLWVFLLILLILMALANHGQWRNALKWLGATLAVSGIASLMLFAVLPPLVPGLLFPQAPLEGTPEYFLLPLLGALLGEIAAQGMFLAGAMTLIGGVLFIIWFLKKTHESGSGTGQAPSANTSQ